MALRLKKKKNNRPQAFLAEIAPRVTSSLLSGLPPRPHFVYFKSQWSLPAGRPGQTHRSVLRYLSRDRFLLLGVTHCCFAYRALQSEFLFFHCFPLCPPARAQAPPPDRHWRARPAPLLTQGAARCSEGKMAARAPGEAAGPLRG